MSRAAPLLACLLALCLLGCGKKRAVHEDEELEERDESGSYEPDPTEVPLTADFEKAVKRRVRVDNYRDELARIERELKLSRQQ